MLGFRACSRAGRSGFAVVLALAMLAAPGGAAGAQWDPTRIERPGVEAEPVVRFFFLADMHSRHARMARFLEEAARERPELVLEGGDVVHDGTEAEFRRAFVERASLGLPWHIAPGNHDTELRGPFAGPPPDFPAFRSLEHRGVRFILLDNHEEVLTEEQFQRLEAELSAHPGARIVVVMHVPAILSREPLATRLRHVLPFRLASPVMREPAQVERFTRLMERHGVLAVLAGHTHVPDHVVRGGVHYIVAGAAGGLTPGLGIANEYLDVRLVGREVSVRRIALAEPPRDPLSFVAGAFLFYARLNHFNHREQGWNYVPSASVQWKSGVRRTEAAAGETVAVWGAADFERLLGEAGRHAFLGNLGLSVGRREVVGHLATGYKVRPLGDFNRNFFVAAATTANAGLLSARTTAGVGAQLGLGLEWRDLTLEASRGRATNHRASTLALGRRF